MAERGELEGLGPSVGIQADVRTQASTHPQSCVPVSPPQCQFKVCSMVKKIKRVESKKDQPELNEGEAEQAWLIVVTHGGKEGLVVPQLMKAGFEVYRPMAHKTVVHARQTQIRAVPVFPRHLFVRRPGHMYSSVFGVLGVAWVYTQLLPPKEIDGLKAEENKGYIELIGGLDPDYGALKAGDKVAALGGLVDLIITEEIDAKRVAALSNFMNGAARVTLDISRTLRKKM